MYGVTNLISSLASSLKWLVRPLGKGSEVRVHGNVDPRTFVHGAGGVVHPGSIPRVYALSVGLPGGLIVLNFLLLVSVPLIIVL